MKRKLVRQMERPLPQGCLEAQLLRSTSTMPQDPSEFHDEIYHVELRVVDADPWDLQVTHEFFWRTAGDGTHGVTEKGGHQPFLELLELLVGFYEQLLTGAQEAGVPLPPQDHGGVSATHHRYPLRGSTELPELLEILLLMLRSRNLRGASAHHEDFLAWLTGPPQPGGSLELYYLLASPLYAFINPWRHVFYHNNLWLVKDAISRKTLEAPGLRDFFQRLFAAASMNRRGGDASLKLLEHPVRDETVALGAWDLAGDLTRKSVDLLLMERNTLTWSHVDKLSNMPLARAGFRDYLTTVPLKDLQTLLARGNFSKGMAAEVAVTHAEHVLSNNLKPPALAELTQLLADATRRPLREGEVDLPLANNLSAAFLSLGRSPATYACLRAHVDEREAQGQLLSSQELLDLVSSTGETWCLRPQERDAILVNLVSSRGAREAQRIILEVAALGNPLTGKQWHTYVAQAEGDLQGLPTSMWVKLV